MTNLAKIEANEERERIFARALWRCEVCGGLLRHGVPQLAHRIPATKRNLNLYGPRVIHHRLNLAPTCSLRCNDAVLIGNDIEAREALLDAIYSDIDKEKEA